ncbi:DedA family protein [Actinomadura madurae]|uniref:DedA family protein n=1 Tax=Actinomadura madurae TaxID=1993 RepID=UPI00202744AF|nr:DedA family protein [Actinomadura madurae]URN00791.1 DedA family protein [Actinomadura madurae]
MIDWVELTESMGTSWWLYLILMSVSLLDSFLPLIPSEPVIIIAGVFAATGSTNLTLVIAATAVGAFLGDQIPYALGRRLSARVQKRLPDGSRRRATHDWISRHLDLRGGFVLVSTRFIPVGRYLVTVTTGMVRYDYRRYVLFTAVGGTAWSAYTVLTGYLGGVLFQENALLAFLVGLGLALVMSGVMEVTRRVRARGGVA